MMHTRPAGLGGKRPDRSVIVYSQQRIREAYKDTPIVIGGIEASLRRIAHFDYWSEKVRRSILIDAKADHPHVRERGTPAYANWHIVSPRASPSEILPICAALRIVRQTGSRTQTISK